MERGLSECMSELFYECMYCNRKIKNIKLMLDELITLSSLMAPLMGELVREVRSRGAESTR
jgi:hypothetical protein